MPFRSQLVGIQLENDVLGRVMVQFPYFSLAVKFGRSSEGLPVGLKLICVWNFIRCPTL